MTSTPGAHRCDICGATQGTPYRVREMMFGSRQPFDYWLCGACGCCQLVTVPDLKEHYPRDYHAYLPQPRPTGLRGRLRGLRDRGVFTGHPLGRLLARLYPYPVRGADRWFRRMGVARDARILDVGCGTGELLKDLRAAGFARAEGIDPFLPAEHEAPLRGLVRRISLADVQGAYDVVMLHHVLEHIPDQRDTLRHVARVLAPRGWCLIRIPKLPNAAWEQYREHWVQLDAPRHLFIHTDASLRRLATEAGLAVLATEDDSTEFQFAGSELYARDMPLDKLSSAWTPRQLRAFRRQATRLNRVGRGDQAAWYLRHADAA